MSYPPRPIERIEVKNDTKSSIPTLKVSSIALCAGLAFACTLLFQNCSPVARGSQKIEQQAGK